MRKIKKIFKLILNEFVYGGHLLSLGTLGIVWMILILLNQEIKWPILIIAYLLSQIIYTYNHFREIKIDLLTNPERAGYLQRIIKYFPWLVLFYSSLLFLLLILFANLQTISFVIFLLMSGILFTLYFKRVTKKIVGFKNFYVSFFWTAGIFLPFFYYSLSLNLLFILLILFFFYLRFFIGTCFSDVKDIESDRKEGLLTLAVVLGKKNLINVLLFINILTAIPIIIGFYSRIFPACSLMLLLSVPYSFYYLFKSVNEKINTTFLYNVIVDGEIIMWFIFVLIGKILL